MEAIRVHEFGGPEVVELEDVPRPEPGTGEVLVRVEGAGVNPIDWKTRRGRGVPVHLPWVPGWDVSGVVEATGPGVAEWEPGDAVYGMPSFPDAADAYAEYTAVPADDLARAPGSLDLAVAGGVPLAALTAWQALFDAAGLEADQRVLVHAAAGGVGHFAVQFAGWAGARVAGTASGYNEAYLRELGVEEFVDYREERFEEVLAPVDVVLDAVGGETQDRSFEVLKEGGVLVALTAPPSESRAREHGVRTKRLGVRPGHDQLRRIAELLETGSVRVTVADVLPLEDAAGAHRRSEEGHVRGKLILAP